MRYRPGLDGIRALAILSVFSAHAAIPGIRGGGLGVQVFFALSGYLITSLLLSESARYGAVGFHASSADAVYGSFPLLFSCSRSSR
jgi:peptidoglycan/LPS O-acetylase OafA/YrhL